MKRGLLALLLLLGCSDAEKADDAKPDPPPPLTLPSPDISVVEPEVQVHGDAIVEAFCTALAEGNYTKLADLTEELASAQLSPADLQRLSTCATAISTPAGP